MSPATPSWVVSLFTVSANVIDKVAIPSGSGPAPEWGVSPAAETEHLKCFQAEFESQTPYQPYCESFALTMPPLPIDNIEEMIRQVRFYGTGWEICRAGNGKDQFLVIKPIKPTVPSASPAPND